MKENVRKVLAITVGGEPNPIVYACKRHEPDFVIFFVTTEPGGGSRRLLVEETEKGPSIVKQLELNGDSYEIVTLPDPDDFMDCFRRMDEALQEYDTAPQRIADYTGGTKTMSASLAFAGALRGWDLSVVAGMRRDTVKVSNGTEMTRLTLNSSLRIRISLELARVLYEEKNFAGAAKVLEDLTTTAQLPTTEADRLNELLTLLRALSAWDRLNYEEALPLLRSVGGLWGEGCERLARIWGKGELSYSVVEDLVGNALRLAHQKRFEDAILRLYRACELLAQLRLRKEYGLNTGDLDLQNPKLSQLPEDLAQLLRERKERENRAWAGLLESYRILAALGDPLGKVFSEKWGERLKDLLRMRNSLFLTHGLNPVAEAEWERARDLVQGFFADAFAALNRGFSPVKFPEAKGIFSS